MDILQEYQALPCGLNLPRLVSVARGPVSPGVSVHPYRTELTEQRIRCRRYARLNKGEGLKYHVGN